MTQSTPSAARRAFPERVERYELLLPIGAGGSATVFLARSPLLDGVYRDVAVKLMHPKLDASDGRFADELLEEARLVAAIRHPNVVSILDVGDSPQGVYLVMDYVAGDTLSGLIRALLAAGRRMPLPIAARILLDALLGLHVAHELVDAQGKPLELVHRDFSPQNLLIGSDGVTRLTDFGIAKVTGRIDGTASGIVKGKVRYMSPEQALGERLDRRSDIWAAGVVAWELLAQRRLFDKDEDAAVLLSIVSSDPPDVRTVREDCPEACARVISRALSRDRARRYDTALELRDALLEAFRGSVGVAEIDGVGRFVRELVEPQLAERDLRAREIQALRASLRATSNQPPDVALAASGAAPTRRALSLWAAGLGVTLLAGLGVAVRYLGPDRPVAASSPAPTPPAAAPLATSTSLPSAAASASLVRFTSSLPVSGLSLGGKSIFIPQPTTTLEVELPADATLPIAVQARAVDGRVSRAELAPGVRELALQFGSPKTSTPAPRRGAVHKPAAQSPSTELAPPPYE